MLIRALVDIQDAADDAVRGRISIRHDPMAAIEEMLHDEPFDEIIVSVAPAHHRTMAARRSRAPGQPPRPARDDGQATTSRCGREPQRASARTTTSCAASLRDALEREGLTVRATASGTEAVRTFGADPPDVLVLDIGLPDADGRDVCQALRARGRAQPGPLPDRARRAARPAQRLPRRRRRLPDQAVRARRAARARPRAAAARRRPPSEPVEPNGARARSGRARGQPRRRAACALTPTEFRVLAALAARPGRGRCAARALVAAGMARRRDRARQHARRLHRPHPPQAARRPARREADRDGARRRLPPAVSFRTRLLPRRSLTLAVGLGALLVAGNVLLRPRRRTPRRTSAAARPRRGAARGAERHAGGRVASARPPTTRRSTAARGCSTATRVVERPAAVSPALGPRGGRARARAARTAERDGPGDVRLRAAPVIAPGGRAPVGAVVVGAARSSRSSTCSTRCSSARSCSPRWCCSPAALAIRGALDGALRPVAQMTDERRGLGRARPRPPLRPRPAARRAHRPGGDARRAARADRGLAPPRAALRQRGRPRAAHADRRPARPRRARARGAAAPHADAEREEALRAVVAEADAARPRRSTRCSRSRGASSTRRAGVGRPRRARARVRRTSRSRVPRPAPAGRGRARGRPPRARAAGRQRAPPRARARRRSSCRPTTAACALAVRDDGPGPRSGARRARVRARACAAARSAGRRGARAAARAAARALLRRRRRRRPRARAAASCSSCPAVGERSQVAQGCRPHHARHERHRTHARRPRRSAARC